MTADRSSCTAPRHATASAYRYGCRCPDAREARRLYMKRRREGRLRPAHVPAVGTARRLQALAAIGWGLGCLSGRSGVSKDHLFRLRSHRYELITKVLAGQVGRLYEELQGTPGPSMRARELATLKRWGPPLAWDDEAIDDPSARPVTALDTRRDVAAEARFLASFGESLESIAKQLGVRATSVERAIYRDGEAS